MDVRRDGYGPEMLRVGDVEADPFFTAFNHEASIRNAFDFIDQSDGLGG